MTLGANGYYQPGPALPGAGVAERAPPPPTHPPTHNPNDATLPTAASEARACGAQQRDGFIAACKLCQFYRSETHLQVGEYRRAPVVYVVCVRCVLYI